MAKQSRSSLETRASGVKSQQTQGGNSATVIGQLFLDYIASVPTDFDADRVYNPGDLAIWKGRNIKCFETTSKGQTPETAPGKWIDDTIDSLEKLGAEGQNLPVLASALKAYVSQRIGEVNAGGGLSLAKASIDDMNERVNDSAYVTPYLIGQVFDAFIDIVENAATPFIQKSLLELVNAASVGELATTREKLAYRLNELADLDAEKNVRFLKGAQPVVYRMVNTQAGLNIEIQKPDGSYEFGMFLGAKPDGSFQWVDKFGSFRSEAEALVFSFASTYFSGLVRAYQMYIINQDELSTTDFLTTSNPYGPLGSFKQNRISFESLFKQFLVRSINEFTGQVVVRSLSVTTLPTTVVTPSLFAIAQSNPETGRYDIKFATAGQVAEGIIAQVISRLPPNSGTGGATVSANQAIFLGCIEETIPASKYQNISVANPTDNQQLEHNLQTVAIWTTAISNPNVTILPDGPDHVRLSIPEGLVLEEVIFKIEPKNVS